MKVADRSVLSLRARCVWHTLPPRPSLRTGLRTCCAPKMQHTHPSVVLTILSTSVRAWAARAARRARNLQRATRHHRVGVHTRLPCVGMQPEADTAEGPARLQPLALQIQQVSPSLRGRDAQHNSFQHPHARVYTVIRTHPWQWGNECRHPSANAPCPHSHTVCEEAEEAVGSDRSEPCLPTPPWWPSFAHHRKRSVAAALCALRSRHHSSRRPVRPTSEGLRSRRSHQQGIPFRGGGAVPMVAPTLSVRRAPREKLRCALRH